MTDNDPTHILALEYCQRDHPAAKSVMRPLCRPAPRRLSRRTSRMRMHPSATAVRALILTGGDWAAVCPGGMRGLRRGRAAPRLGWRRGARDARAPARPWSRRLGAAPPYGSEGLWSEVWKAVLSQPGLLEGILAAAKSKRYPRTRLQRLLLCAYLGISEESLRQSAALRARAGL
ncbi:MAG: nucleotidyltransferase family protein [Blautia wexlerae]